MKATQDVMAWRGARVLSLVMRLVPPVFVAASLGAGCSAEQGPEPGQVVVALTTNMEPGRDFDDVALDVERVDVAGPRERRWQYAWADGGTPPRFPATFSLVNQTSAEPLVRVRIEAKQRGRLRIVREALVAIPSAGRDVLPMQLDWACLDKIPVKTPTDVQCAEDQSCVAGVCTKPAREALEPFDPAQIFGGGSGTGASGTCFDVLGTYNGSTTYVPENLSGPCGVPWSGPDANLNVAVALPAGSAGFCYTSGGGGCFVPLEKGGASGWSVTNGRLTVPDRVCATAGAKVAVVQGKPTKAANQPPCGSFSSVGSPDAGTAPTATIVVTDADAGAPLRDGGPSDGGPGDATVSTDGSLPVDAAPDGGAPDAPSVEAGPEDAGLADGGVGDPCATTTCNTPPGATCANGTTRRTYASTGTCSSGSGTAQCSYASTDTACNTPPSAVCASGTSVTTYASAGTCASGN